MTRTVRRKRTTPPPEIEPEAVATQPVAGPNAWLALLLDYRPLLPDKRFRILAALMRQLDWKTGAGYCSEQTLADVTGAGKRTVRDTLKWARDTGYLIRTRKGHRLGDGTTRASEWLLRQPAVRLPVENSQPADELPVETSQPAESACQPAEPTMSTGSSSDPPSHLGFNEPRVTANRGTQALLPSGEAKKLETWYQWTSDQSWRQGAYGPDHPGANRFTGETQASRYAPGNRDRNHTWLSEYWHLRMLAALAGSNGSE